MNQTAADVMIDTLIDYDVDLIFGLPGDGINGLMESLRKHQNHVRFIQVRHEESAAFMATGYAKYTGKMGVCLATSGPGGIHLLNGLYDAKMDGQSVLAITGMLEHDLIDTHTQQDVDTDHIYQDVAFYNARIMGPSHVENVTSLACRKAMSYNTVSHISFPNDFQSMLATHKDASKRNVAEHIARKVKPRVHRSPHESDLRQAANILNSGNKIAIIVGRGAFGSSEEILQVAEILGAPIAKALLGKAVIPDDSIYSTGTIGLLGTRPSTAIMEKCDTLMMIGTSFPYIEYLPKPGQARSVQLDIDPSRIGLRYPVDVGLVGDCKETLKALIPLLVYNENRNFLEVTQDSTRRWWYLMKERGSRKTVPMKPQVVAWELGKRLPDNALVSCDSGTIATWWARQIPVKKGQMHTLSGNLASMASGLPYAIAGQLAYPDRPTFAFVGDGGFSMLMADFVTAVRYKLPIKVIIIKNNTLGQVKWEQMLSLGNPEYGCDLTPIDFKQFAKACGATGFSVSDPRQCGDILDKALATEGPVIVEAIVDPFEPPLPAKLNAEQVKHFAQSLAAGTPHRGRTLSTVITNRLQ